MHTHAQMHTFRSMQHPQQTSERERERERARSARRERERKASGDFVGRSVVAQPVTLAVLPLACHSSAQLTLLRCTHWRSRGISRGEIVRCLCSREVKLCAASALVRLRRWRLRRRHVGNWSSGGSPAKFDETAGGIGATSCASSAATTATRRSTFGKVWCGAYKEDIGFDAGFCDASGGLELWGNAP